MYCFVFILPLRNEYSVKQNTDNFFVNLTSLSLLRNAQTSVRPLEAVTSDLTVATLETSDFVTKRFALVVVRFKILTVVTVTILAMCKTNGR